MSIIQPSAIQAIAHSVDIPRLSDEAAKSLAPDVEYRLREVVQEALKFAKHAKRTKLTTDDINNALRLRNVEPLYGFGSRDPAKFLRVAAHPELAYVRDPELSFNQLIEAPLPKLPRDAGVTAHWLAINGVQPDLPENAPVEQPPPKRQALGPGRKGTAGLESAASLAGAVPDAAMQAAMPVPAADPAAAAAAAAAAPRAAGLAPPGGGAAGAAVGGQALAPRSVAGAAVQLQLPLRHAVSRELQVYFDKLVGLLTNAPAAGAGSSGLGAGSGAAPRGAAGQGDAGPPDKQAALLRGALASVAADPGLHPLVPYFSAFIAEGVRQHLGSLLLLGRLLALARALLANPGVSLEPYLQQLLPAVVTCVVTKTLGTSVLDDHWALRRQAAALLASITAAFSAPHHNLAPRLCRVLGQAFLDPELPLTSKYGAVVGLQALGPQVVRTLLIPHLEPFVSSVLVPAMAGAAAAADGGAQPPPQQQQPQVQAQQVLQLEAWQVYGALVSATGGAMYDQLMQDLRSRLPLSLVLPHTSRQGADWRQDYAQSLLAARRGAPAGRAGSGSDQARPQQEQQQDGQPPQQQQAQQPGRQQGQTPPPLEQQRQQQPVGAAAQGSLQGPPALRGARRGGRPAGGSAEPSVAEVLGASWKEDSDVNATLGALLALFGEDLLPFLPLAEVAAVSL